MKTHNFTADTTSFELLRDEVGIGKVYELTSVDASLLATHIETHPETLYIACSGVDIGGDEGSLLLPDERKVAIEWIREERKPRTNELETNMYRYIFGLTSQGQCIGYEEYDFRSTASNQQVGDHWMSLDELCNRYPFQ